MCPYYWNTPFSLLLSNSLILLSNGPHSVSKKFSFALYPLGLRPGAGVPVISVALPGLCPGIAVYSRSSRSLTFLFTEPALFIMDVFCPATVFALLSSHLDSSKVSWNPSPWPSLPTALTAHDAVITPSQSVKQVKLISSSSIAYNIVQTLSVRFLYYNFGWHLSGTLNCEFLELGPWNFSLSLNSQSILYHCIRGFLPWIIAKSIL